MKTQREQEENLIKLYVNAEINYLKTDGDRFWSDKMSMYEHEFVKLSEKDKITDDQFYKEHFEKMKNTYEIN